MWNVWSFHIAREYNIRVGRLHGLSSQTVYPCTFFFLPTLWWTVRLPLWACHLLFRFGRCIPGKYLCKRVLRCSLTRIQVVTSGLRVRLGWLFIFAEVCCDIWSVYTSRYRDKYITVVGLYRHSFNIMSRKSPSAKEQVEWKQDLSFGVATWVNLR